MAARAAQYLRLLYVCRNFGSSHLIASSGCVPALQGGFWSKPRVLGRLGAHVNGMRYCSTTSGGDEEEGDGKEEGNDEGEKEGELDAEEEDDLWDEQIKEQDMKEGGLVGIRGGQQYAIAPVSIPDIFPEVPVLPVSRNPIFPKFVKLLEVRQISLGFILRGEGEGI